MEYFTVGACDRDGRLAYPERPEHVELAGRRRGHSRVDRFEAEGGGVLEIGAARLANAEGATFPDLARVRAVRAHLLLGPLFSGRLEIESLTLVDPVLELERLADGRPAWILEGEADTDTAQSSFGDASVSIGRIHIRGGALTYRSADGIARIDALNATVQASALDGPFQAEG